MKKISIILISAMMAISLTACGNIKSDAKKAVDAYNAELTAYNTKAIAYNDAVQDIMDANDKLKTATDAAQEALNKNEEPFNEETMTALKDAMMAAQSAKIEAPEKLQEFEELSVNEDAEKETLKALKAQAEADIQTMKEMEIPDAPEVPDYSEVISAVTDAQEAYEDSVQSMKQITAPTDDFVMERLQRVDTVTAIAAVTEDHDPNGQLGKQGGYIGCIYWSDNEVDTSELYIDTSDVIEVGTQGGGAIEIFNTAEEATVRSNYLGAFDGSALSSGSHYVYGTIVIRTSNYLTGTQQQNLTQKVLEALTEIDK